MSDLYQLGLGSRLAELAYEGMGGSELDLTPSEFLVLSDLFMPELDGLPRRTPLHLLVSRIDLPRGAPTSSGSR